MLSPAAREHASLAYRLEGEQEGHLRRVLDIPEARRVLEEQNLARLHESGWRSIIARLGQAQIVAGRMPASRRIGRKPSFRACQIHPKPVAR